MAWMEYLAVRNSTVYENKGLAKSLLMTIALMIQRAEEGEEPTENEGWCFASERYLAESLGMSESRVCVWVEVFVNDGWLVVEQTRNAHGHRHNRYRLADKAMSRLEKFKRERGAERPKNLNKVRADSIKNFLRARSGEEDSTRDPRVGHPSHTAPSNEASALGAMKPSRSERAGLTARSTQRSGGRSLGESLGEDASSPAQLDTDKTQTSGTASLKPAQVPAATLEVEDKGRGLRPPATPVGQGISPAGEPEEGDVPVQSSAPTARPTPDAAAPLPKPSCGWVCHRSNFKKGVCQKCARVCQHDEDPRKPGSGECRFCDCRIEEVGPFKWAAVEEESSAAREVAAP